MPGFRGERIGALVQQEVARRLREEIKDPRVESITITRVTMSPDLSVARVFYIPFAGAPDTPEIRGALKDAGRRLRGSVGRALGIRSAPEIRFEHDRNVEHAARMEEVFRNLPRPAEPDVPAEDPTDAGES